MKSENELLENHNKLSDYDNSLELPSSQEDSNTNNTTNPDIRKNPDFTTSTKKELEDTGCSIWKDTKLKEDQDEEVMIETNDNNTNNKNKNKMSSAQHHSPGSVMPPSGIF